MALIITGKSYSDLDSDNLRCLGELLATIMYGEFDTCAKMLMAIDKQYPEIVGAAAYKLYLLCDVITEE